jgi:hypothetical protein
MTPAPAPYGPEITRFSRPLPRTPFGAIITLRGATCGEGFGACLSCLRQAECRFCPQRRNGYASKPLRAALRLFRFGFKRLDHPQRCNASKPVPYMCAYARACAITRATVAALQRCAPLSLFLYLPEKKEEKGGVSVALPATPAYPTVAGGVAAWLSPCFGWNTIEKRGF